MSSQVPPASARPEPDRPGETEAERDDRNTMELLNELRVVGIGVQVLFGFLLSLPFTNRFTKLDSAQHGIYLATVVFAALSIALLVAPVAYHRLLFRRHEKATCAAAGCRRAAGTCDLDHTVPHHRGGRTCECNIGPAKFI